ncbi:hypothetical protein OR1_00057 [Geobacter sp. OR-1]|uniref:hypothetical protein n=1 Tax=Geobacter sp. OR-1 TaxID=1266765 RepID=UPI000542D6BA|nr:hypothetical protein [Geobacter sp. OR-1]GAM07788.1 hypothetical protein OR1_00057 [Geobacter sp. OR-1]
MKIIQKNKLILSGTPILKVPSRFRPLPLWQKAIVFLVTYSAGFLFAGNAVLLTKVPWWVRVLGLCLGAIFAGLGHLIVFQANARKNGMIVTDVGVSIGPLRCALWSEITAWNFSTFSGLKQVTFTHAGEGVSLHLFTGELKISQGPFAGSRGGTAFAEEGYFFDETQQVTLQRVFAEHNIPKW